MDNPWLLIVTTVHLYKVAFLGACRALVRNWHVPFFHAIGLAALSVLVVPIGLLGPFIGGFVFALILTLFLAAYFSTVDTAMEPRTVKLAYLWQEALSLFGPFLNALFFLFIINLLADLMVSGMPFARVAINLFSAVLLNPLPEVVTHSRHRTVQVLGESFEFIRENFVEWFLPFAAIILLIVAGSSLQLLDVWLYTTTTNPVYVVQNLVFNLGQALLHGSNLLVVVVLLYAMYFIFLFRYSLFVRLATSSRRKRLYQFRMGE